jgi:hypothetical protein
LRVKKWFSNWVSSACPDDHNDERSVTTLMEKWVRVVR